LPDGNKFNRNFSVQRIEVTGQIYFIIGTKKRDQKKTTADDIYRK